MPTYFSHVRRIVLCLMVGVAAGAPSVSLAQTKVTIGTAKDPNLGSQILIAGARGFFRDEGIEADIKFFPTGGDLLSAFVGGSIQIGSASATPATVLRARPYPVTIIAQLADTAGGNQLIVREGTTELQQLYGKKVGLLKGTSSEALWNAVLRLHPEFDAGRVQLINMGGTEMLQGFTLGVVDGVVLWEPHSTRARKNAKGKILISGTHDHTGNRTVAQRIIGEHALLFTSESFVQQNPAAVRGVLAALAKADEFMRNNEPEATRILATTFEFSVEDMREVLGANRYTLRLDAQLVADLESVGKTLVAGGRIKEAPKARDWISGSLLGSVRPGWVALD